LGETELRELIPKAGPRSKFRVKWEAWKATSKEVSLFFFGFRRFDSGKWEKVVYKISQERFDLEQ
jgi:hypothetical protein